MSDIRAESRHGADRIEFSTLLRLVTNGSFSGFDCGYLEYGLNPGGALNDVGFGLAYCKTKSSLV